MVPSGERARCCSCCWNRDGGAELLAMGMSWPLRVLVCCCGDAAWWPVTASVPVPGGCRLVVVVVRAEVEVVVLSGE